MSGYKFHIKVFLATGVIENYYPELPDKTININLFRLLDDQTKEFMGWIFQRDGTVDFFSPDMVKGIHMGAFKGFVANVDGHEIYCKSPNDTDVKAALKSELKKAQERAQALKEYLQCKSS